MSKKLITIVLRSPFLDKIPSLKNLVVFLGEHGVRVKILSVYDADYPECQIENPNVRIKTVPQRTRKLQVPTSINLMRLVLNDFLFNRSTLYLGGDGIGCKILTSLRKFFKFRYWNFLLEYPDIESDQDFSTLTQAEKIITHDSWHSRFLNKHCATSDNQFLYLPNSTYTDVHVGEKTNYLSRKLGIDENARVILHSGGLGEWFLCKELAESFDSVDKNNTLVFHVSHNVSNSLYYRQIRDIVEERGLNVRFSLNPVSNTELDELVASAHIGLAFYSLPKLSYRAEFMGLAAGKIGNYLKCGVPVIATDVCSLKYISEYKCGVLISSFSQMNEAIAEIMANYEEYSNNALRCYRELWEPSEYLKKILTSI